MLDAMAKPRPMPALVFQKRFRKLPLVPRANGANALGADGKNKTKIFDSSPEK
jgi:hypothetical protein